jgi:hypothetical protein
MQSAESCSAELSSAKSNIPELETRGSDISRSSDNLRETSTNKPDDWRTLLVCYLDIPNHIADRKVRWQDLKYIVLDNDLYC